jgi:hypothetical protein
MSFSLWHFCEIKDRMIAPRVQAKPAQRLEIDPSPVGTIREIDQTEIYGTKGLRDLGTKNWAWEAKFPFVQLNSVSDSRTILPLLAHLVEWKRA